MHKPTWCNQLNPDVERNVFQSLCLKLIENQPKASAHPQPDLSLQQIHVETQPGGNFEEAMPSEPPNMT
jgi:hypothetical protein